MVENGKEDENPTVPMVVVPLASEFDAWAVAMDLVLTAKKKVEEQREEKSKKSKNQSQEGITAQLRTIHNSALIP